MTALCLVLLAADAAAWSQMGGRLEGSRLDLRTSWVTDADLPAVAALPGVKVLDLSMTRISDRGLAALKPMKGVEDLNLYYAELITDEGMAAVKGWTRLRRVNLRGTKVTDTTLEHLSGLPAIEFLDAGYAQVTDVGIEHLAQLSALKQLTLGGNKLTDMGLQALRQTPGIQSLDLGGQQRTDSGLWQVSVTDRGMDAIATLSDLRHLRLHSLTVTARHLRQLAGLKKLETLDLQNCKKVGDDAVEALSSISSLRRVDLTGSGMTAEAVARLRSRLSSATILH
jgi:Leucine-rich repeat (LRR) protein